MRRWGGWVSSCSFGLSLSPVEHGPAPKVTGNLARPACKSRRRANLDSRTALLVERHDLGLDSHGLEILAVVRGEYGDHAGHREGDAAGDGAHGQEDEGRDGGQEC